MQKRFGVIDRLRREQPVQAWRLMLGILPGHHDSLVQPPKTRWRDFTPDDVEVPTYPLMDEGALGIIERLLQDVGTNASKWVTLLDRLADFRDRVGVIQQLRGAIDKISDPSERLILWTAIRRLLHHHREFADTDWSLPEEELAQLEEIYDLLTPADQLNRYAWLFDHGAGLPNPEGDFTVNHEQLAEVQRKTAPQLLAEHGPDLIFAIAERIEGAATLGVSLAMGGMSDTDRDAMLARALQRINPKHHALADGIIRANIYPEPIKREFAETLLAKALKDEWGSMAVQTILATLPSDRWTWALAKTAGPQEETAYWQRADTFRMPNSGEEAIESLERMAAVGRPHDAVRWAGHIMRGMTVPSSLLVRLLLEAAKTPLPDSHIGNAVTMFQHYVAEVLTALDKADDVPREDLIGLEWAYLPILEHSRRPPKIITSELARNPELFMELICAVFRPSEDSGVVEEPPADRKRAERLASQAYRLLNMWAVVPGTQDDGTIDAQALNAWVRAVRKLAQEKGRLDITDQKIGEILSAAPVGSDGIWPALPVRDLIDHGLTSKHIDSGFELGKRNRRGMTVRMPRDGGELERSEAGFFRKMSRLTNVDWPHISAILDRLAKSYEHDAGWHDDDAERLDW